MVVATTAPSLVERTTVHFERTTVHFVVSEMRPGGRARKLASERTIVHFPSLKSAPQEPYTAPRDGVDAGRKTRLYPPEDLHIDRMNRRTHHHGGGKVRILPGYLVPGHRLDHHHAKDDVGIGKIAARALQVLMTRQIDVGDQLPIFVKSLENKLDHRAEPISEALACPRSPPQFGASIGPMPRPQDPGQFLLALVV